jgi:hypothetical protein
MKKRSQRNMLLPGAFNALLPRESTVELGAALPVSGLPLTANGAADMQSSYESLSSAFDDVIVACYSRYRRS